MKLFRATTKSFYSTGPSVSHPFVSAENITDALATVEADIHKTFADPNNSVISIREVSGYLMETKHQRKTTMPAQPQTGDSK